jgi:sugar/nucleoside kinase (ribokinase family)
MVDVLATTSDDFVAGQGLEKGSMSLIDGDRAQELLTMIDDSVKASGGSAANTMAGIASFGGTAAYIGKVSNDDLGKVFAEDMRAIGVSFDQPPATTGPPTAMCMVMVTPDAQRTMSTFLGVSALLEPEDVQPEVVERAPLLFCEGYLWDVDSAKQAIRKAMDLAIGAGSTVALTLSDTFCIERHHQEFLELVAGPVQVLFANKAELTTLFECDLDAAISKVADQVELACVTLSDEGSLLVANGEIIKVEAELVGPVVDTTGAGDQYAAGVLYGLSRGLPLPEVGRLGSLAAAEVISHLGPRPERALSEFLQS